MEPAGSDIGAIEETVAFLDYFKELPDPRQAGKVIYPLAEVLLLCLLAVLAGAESFVDIARFGEKKIEFLRRFHGIYDEIRKKVSNTEAQKPRIEDLQKWQDDPQRLAFGICRHFGAERSEIVVVIMDNVDRLNLDNQLAAFQLSLWFLDQSKAFVILQMRDETYERFKDRPPLDTFRSGVVFHITPPRFLDVVKRRLELSLDYLSRNTPNRLEYHLSSGTRITYPNSMLGECGWLSESAQRWRSEKSWHGLCVHLSCSLQSNAWWQTMAG